MPLFQCVIPNRAVCLLFHNVVGLGGGSLCCRLMGRIEKGELSPCNVLQLHANKSPELTRAWGGKPKLVPLQNLQFFSPILLKIPAWNQKKRGAPYAKWQIQWWTYIYLP